MPKRIFISADHGMAIIYFLQSDVVSTLLNAGIEIVVLTDDETKEKIAQRFARPGLAFEGLRLKQANDYAKKVSPRLQSLLAYLRRVGGSRRINTEAMDSHIWEVWVENGWKFRLGIWIPSALAIPLSRNFPFVRKFLLRMQNRFTPDPGIYTDLFDKYNPDMVIASPPGWRMDAVINTLRKFLVLPMLDTINAFVDVRDVARAVTLALPKGSAANVTSSQRATSA